MSQRIRRAQGRKATMATGGLVSHHNRGEVPEVRVPQRATGDVSGENLPGLAKASPFFKKLAEMQPPTKAAEQKAIAEAIEDVVDDEPEEVENDEQEAD